MLSQAGFAQADCRERAPALNMYKVACQDKFSVVGWVQDVSGTLQHAIPETERIVFQTKSLWCMSSAG